MESLREQKNILYWIGKILLVGVFIYFGVESILTPDIYVSFIPSIVSSIIDPALLVMLHGALEILCVLLILFGVGRRIPYIGLLVLFLLIIASVSNTTLVRDIGILGGLLLLTHRYKAITCTHGLIIKEVIIVIIYYLNYEK